jgi:hypothetical protein
MIFVNQINLINLKFTCAARLSKHKPTAPSCTSTTQIRPYSPNENSPQPPCYWVAAFRSLKQDNTDFSSGKATEKMEVENM